MKLYVCLLTILGFFGCSEKTQEQMDLEEIVLNEEPVKKEIH
jgi:hypothetical protein